MQKQKLLTSLFLVSCISAQCTELQNISTSQNNDDGDANPAGTFESDLSGGNVTPIELSEGSFAYHLDLEDKSEAVIMVVSYNDNEEQNGFQILNSESDETGSEMALKAVSDFTKTDVEDQTEDAHEDLRWNEENLSYFERLTPEETQQSTLVATSQNSDEKTFRVISSFSDTSQYTEINTYLVYDGDHIEVRLDERDFENLTSAQIDTIVELASDYDQNIYEREVEMFGQPSDVDGNGKIYVVPTREVNGYYNDLGVFVTGYFFAGDTYSRQVHSASNEAEVVFTIVPDPKGSLGATTSDTIFSENIFEGVIAHEIQHCINFNEHYILGGGAIEIPSLNESLSHLAEDLLPQSLENISRLSAGLSDIANTSIIGSGTGLAERGLGYFMLAWLYDHADHFPNVESGDDMVRKLVTNKYRGLENIKSVLFGDPNDNDSLGETMSLIGSTIINSNTENDDGDLNHFDRFSLRAIANDNRGTYLNGPAVMNLGSNTFTGVLEGVSIAYIKVSETSLSQNGTIYLNFENTDTIKAFLIQ